MAPTTQPLSPPRHFLDLGALDAKTLRHIVDTTHAMKCAGFLTMLQRGTEWAATGAVTLPVPDNFPGPDKVVPLDPTKPKK